jgi:hypothetical protein
MTCSQCNDKDVITIQLGKDSRKLCKYHYNQHLQREAQHEVTFTKASEYNVEALNKGGGKDLAW